MIGVQDTVETGILGLKNYVRNSKERLLITTQAIENDEDRKTPNEYKRRKKNKKNAVEIKAITWTIYQTTKGKASDHWWRRVKKRCLERKTEALIMAAQEQAIRTNNLKSKIDKTQEKSKCRMCGKAEESINHVLSERIVPYLCYPKRKIKDDMIYLKQRSFGNKQKILDRSEKTWCENKLEAVMENLKCKMLWDFRV